MASFQMGYGKDTNSSTGIMGIAYDVDEGPNLYGNGSATTIPSVS